MLQGSIPLHGKLTPFVIILILQSLATPCRGIETVSGNSATRTYYFVPENSKRLQIRDEYRPIFSKLLTDPTIISLSNSDLAYHCVDDYCKCGYVALFKSNYHKGLFCTMRHFGNFEDIWMSFYDDLTDSWSELYFTGYSFSEIDRVINNLKDYWASRYFNYEIYLTSTSVLNDVVTLEFQLRYVDHSGYRVINTMSLDFNISEIIKDSDGDGLTDKAEDRLKTDKFTNDTDGDGIGDLCDTNPLSPSGNKCEWGGIYQLVFDDLIVSANREKDDSVLVIMDQLDDDNCPVYSGNHIVLNTFRMKPIVDDGWTYTVNNYDKDINHVVAFSFEYLLETTPGEVMAVVTHSDNTLFESTVYIFRTDRNNKWYIYDKNESFYMDHADAPRYEDQ